jgi:hypothetical protein
MQDGRVIDSPIPIVEAHPPAIPVSVIRAFIANARWALAVNPAGLVMLDELAAICQAAEPMP